MELPQLGDNCVARIIATNYGLTLKKQHSFNSYDDVNIHVLVADVSKNKFIPTVASDGYVLKILNTVDSQKREFINVMHGAIECVSRYGIPTPTPVPTMEGHMFTTENLTTKSGQGMFIVRLFQFVSGQVLEGKPYTAKLCFQVGQLGGKIDMALKNYNRSALMSHSRHWNLREAGNLADKVRSIGNHDDRALVEDVSRHFTKHVLERAHMLQKGTIHADLNEGNILVTSDNTLVDDNRYDVYGVLDFGDLVHEFHVYEVAIAMAYMMIESKHGLDTIETGGHVLAGYLKEMTLPHVDCGVLKECVSARLAQSLTYGAYAHTLDPSNNYCLVTSTRGWPLLRKLWNIPKQELYTTWAAILKDYGIHFEYE